MGITLLRTDKNGTKYYEREQVDTLLAEKDKEIALLKERICNGDVSRLTWIDDCIAKDKEIAELKQKLMPCLNGDCILTCEVVEKYGKENAELKAKLDKAIAERDGNQVCIDALKQKLEDVQASAYAESVDAGMRERRLHRALYKACANWAYATENLAANFLDVYEAKKWAAVYARCIKKVGEFK